MTVESYKCEQTPAGFVVIRKTKRASKVIATLANQKDAKEIVAALNLANDLPKRFPGLANGDDEVDGGDLVEFMGYWGWDDKGCIFECDTTNIAAEEEPECCDECGATVPDDADGVMGDWHEPHCSCHPDNTVSQAQVNRGPPPTPFWSQAMDDTCAYCDGLLVPLGILGHLLHLQCRDCGAQWSRQVEEDVEEVEDGDS